MSIGSGSAAFAMEPAPRRRFCGAAEPWKRATARKRWPSTFPRTWQTRFVRMLTTLIPSGVAYNTKCPVWSKVAFKYAAAGDCIMSFSTASLRPRSRASTWKRGSPEAISSPLARSDSS